MTNVGATLRESGTGESQRPTPSSDFDGLSRASALDQLLKKHADAELKSQVGTTSWIERLGEIFARLEVV